MYDIRSVISRSDELKAWTAISAFQTNDKGELIYRIEDMHNCVREMISFFTKVSEGGLKSLEPKPDYCKVRYSDVDSFIKEVNVRDCLKWRGHDVSYRARLKVMEVMSRLPNIVAEHADNLDQSEILIPDMDEASLKAVLAFAASIESVANAEKKAKVCEKIGWVWTHYQASKEPAK